MADIPGVRSLTQIESARFRSPVSEALMQKWGALANFLAEKTFQEKQFFLNGRYSIITGAQYGVDGLSFFNFDATIINAWAFNLVPGSGGTTELDIQIGTLGGAFASIFSTTPKFNQNSAPYSWVDADGIVTPGTGVTAGVLNPAAVDVTAGQAARIDILQKMTGNPENCGIVLQYRPR